MTERIKIYSENGISLVIPERGDVEIWYQGISNPEINQFLGPVFGQLHTREAEEKFYENLNTGPDDTVFCIYDDEKKIVIGNTGLHKIDYTARKAELGIVILDLENTGKGVGTTAIQLLLKHAFDILGLRKVYLRVLGNNERAVACYKKCGFIEVGRLKDHEYRMGKYEDDVLMEVFNLSEPQIEKD